MQQVDHTRWKTRNVPSNFATKQCCVKSWGFLYLVFRNLKETRENVNQPGIEPGSPDYRSHALTTRRLNPPHWERIHNVSLWWRGPRRQFPSLPYCTKLIFPGGIWPSITNRPGSSDFILIAKNARNCPLGSIYFTVLDILYTYSLLIFWVYYHPICLNRSVVSTLLRRAQNIPSTQKGKHEETN